MNFIFFINSFGNMASAKRDLAKIYFTKLVKFWKYSLIFKGRNVWIKFWAYFRNSFATQWVNSHCCKWPSIEQIIQPSGHTGWLFEFDVATLFCVKPTSLTSWHIRWVAHTAPLCSPLSYLLLSLLVVVVATATSTACVCLPSKENMCLLPKRGLL